MITEPNADLIPDNLYENTGVVETSNLLPFTKFLTVRGIKLLGDEKNTNEFMEQVGQFIEEIFPEPTVDNGIDDEL